MLRSEKTDMLKKFDNVFAVGWTSDEDGEAPPKTVQVGEITQANASDWIFALSESLVMLFMGLAPRIGVKPDMFIEWLNYALKEELKAQQRQFAEKEGVTS